MIQRKYENILASKKGDTLDPDPLAVQQFSGHALEVPLASEATAAVLELGQDISGNLRALARVHEESLSAREEYQQEFLSVTRSIDRTLSYLADVLAAAPWMSK